MRKPVFFLSLIVALSFVPVFAGVQGAAKPRLILLIAEQNIEGPQKSWWASEIDLSASEAIIARKLIDSGCEVLEPSQLSGLVKKNRAFRLLDPPEKDCVKLGNLSKADYVVVGKAVASSGGFAPASNMRSCFANLSAKLIRVKDSKVVAYLDAAGNSVHPDAVTGGREALVKAAENLAPKLVAAVNKQ